MSAYNGCGLILISGVLAVNKTNNPHSGGVYILVEGNEGRRLTNTICKVFYGALCHKQSKTKKRGYWKRRWIVLNRLLRKLYWEGSVLVRPETGEEAPQTAGKRAARQRGQWKN